MAGLFSKLFGRGGDQDAAPPSAHHSAPVTGSAPGPDPKVLDIRPDGDDFFLVTLQMPGSPAFVRRRFHASRPRSRLMAQADTLDALDAYDGDPLGEFERLDPDGAVQKAMVAARTEYKAAQPD